MKKTLGFLLAVAVLAALLSGCGQNPVKSAFEADDEIFTYAKIDREKTQIVVSRTGNIEVKTFCDEFEARNKDVQVIYIDITGGNDNYKPLEDWITRGFVPDVVITGDGFFDKELIPQYFENLSLNPVLQNYEPEALNRAAVANDIYWLPGPSSIYAMSYNKTLFERYGWELPASFDEFITLCARIREDTGGLVEPWNPNAKYDMQFLTAIEAFTYEELFGGVKNRTWYNEFILGEASFAGHMEPFMAVFKELADKGILREEHFSYSATARGNEFSDGEIAMVNGYLSDNSQGEFEFGVMPFPSTNGNPGYVSDSVYCYIGLTKKERSEKQLDAVNRFLNFFSSPEGQRVFIGDSILISNVKDAPASDSALLAQLAASTDMGHRFAYLDFASAKGYASNVDLSRRALQIVTGAATPEQCIRAIDENPYSDAPVDTARVIAKVEKSLTVLQTSQYFADAYRDKAACDIALIAAGEVYRGNVTRLFAGDVTEEMISVLKPRSFANGSTLIKASMTGRQILDALNDPVCSSEDGCVYACSGLECEVAAQNGFGERVLKAWLPGAAPLEESRVYAVAFWDGTVKPEYITGASEAVAGAWEEIIAGYMAKFGVPVPAAGRMKLVWS